MSMFCFDDEQRSRVRDCLQKDGIALSQAAFNCMISKLEDTVDRFRASRPDSTFREAHDALRAIWLAAHKDDPSVGLLRARLADLPRRALEYIEERADHIIPRLFSGETVENGFKAWVANADGKRLIEALQVLSANGARIVQGRSRGAGKRSRRQLEPLIFGEVRGARDDKPKGGRPRAEARYRLVMHLALDWYTGTERMPEPGRSDHTGFGDLVHSIFGWLNEPGAEHTLREYWQQVRSIQSRRADGGMEYF